MAGDLGLGAESGTETGGSLEPRRAGASDGKEVWWSPELITLLANHRQTRSCHFQVGDTRCTGS